ncbi:Fic family protein [Leucobacter sp. HY1910]
MSDDEFQINASRFIETLIEQRAMRLKGGLYHLNQIQMAFNSNRIEGSRLSEDQTRYIYETQTVSGEALSVDDVVETANHFRAFDWMLDHLDEPLGRDKICEYHRILKSGTSDAAKPWFVVGGWKAVANEVGGTATSRPADVDRHMSELLEATPARMLFNDIADFHHQFESIHPFQDGNGRVGRLLMLEQCLRNNIMPFIVLDEQKEFYYRGLKNYGEEPGFLRETLRSFQDRYHDRYAPFVPPQAHSL